MEAKRLELFGAELTLAPDKVSTNTIRIAFEQLERTQRRRIADDFVTLFANLDGLYERADVVANEIRGLAIEQAMKVLAAHGLYEVSEQQFFDRFMDPYDSWDRDFEPVAEAYEAMVERTAELDAHRTARRQNRAKWVGMNERGVHQADAKNLISNVGHGVFNLMAKGVTAIGNAIKKDELFKSPQTQARVRDGLADIVAAAREGVIEALSMLKPGSVHAYSQDEADRAAAIVEHVHKGRVPEADVLSALLRAVEAFPYNRDVHVLLLRHGGGDAGRLDATVAYFGLAGLDAERKQLFEARRRGVDLSTLEALDAQLPALIAYAQQIGHVSFAQEAVSLREAAARRSFEERVRAMGELSVAEVHAGSETLRAHAAEIGVSGADTMLAQALAAARLREFKQEAAKHALATPEDCDRHLPLLQAHARRIGFDGFDAWADTVRQRVASPSGKKGKAGPAAGSDGSGARVDAAGRAPVKPLAMSLGLAVIALVAFGGYQAYAYFATPVEAAPIATAQPQEIAIPIAAPASLPIETASASAPQADAEVQGVPLRPLSPAAEQAIREGFVEIKDPAVRACTDAKVAGFRKEVGEEVPLNYDAYNEFAVACGFNI